MFHKLNKMETSYDRLLRAARELKRLHGPHAIAERLGVSDQTIQNWKTRGVPDNKLVLIEEKIGALPTWIATGNGEMARKPEISESSLTEEQKRVLALMRGIRSDVLATWIKMGDHLFYLAPERRKNDAEGHPGLRLGDIPFESGGITSSDFGQNPPTHPKKRSAS